MDGNPVDTREDPVDDAWNKTLAAVLETDRACRVWVVMWSPSLRLFMAYPAWEGWDGGWLSFRNPWKLAAQMDAVDVYFGSSR